MGGPISLRKERVDSHPARDKKKQLDLKIIISTVSLTSLSCLCKKRKRKEFVKIISSLIYSIKRQDSFED